MLNHWVKQLREKKSHKMSGWEAQSAVSKSTVTLAPTHTVPRYCRAAVPKGRVPAGDPRFGVAASLGGQVSVLLFDLGRVSQGSPRTLSSIKQKWSLALSLPLATGSHTGVPQYCIQFPPQT